MPPRFEVCRPRRVAALALFLVQCGEQGFAPTTVDPGPDFGVAEVVFDAGFYYCRVEPLFFAQRCGAGDPAAGDAANGCHFNVTSFRLTDYMPPVGDSCGDGVVPMVPIPQPAQRNYQSAQARMRRNPDMAPLLLRATGRAEHPRTLFDAMSPEADVIRQWATQYSSQ